MEIFIQQCCYFCSTKMFSSNTEKEEVFSDSLYELSASSLYFLSFAQ